MSGQCYNFDAYSHKQLYDWIHNESDTACMAPANTGESQQAWKDFATLMASAQQRVQDALSRANVEWQGGAATQMQTGVTPMGTWAGDTHAAGTETHGSVTSQDSAYGNAKTAMPAPVQVTATDNSDWGGIPGGVTHLFGGQTDQDQQEAKAKEAKAQAVQVMGTYEMSSSSATSSMGTFTAPPAISGSVASADGQSGTVGGYSGGPGSMSSSAWQGSSYNPGGGGSSSVPPPIQGGPVGPGPEPQPGPGPVRPWPTPVQPGPVGPGPLPTPPGGGGGGLGIGGGVLLGGAVIGGAVGIGGALRGGGKGAAGGMGEAALSEEEELRRTGGAPGEDAEGRLTRGGVLDEEELMRRRGMAGAAGARGASGAAGANGPMAGGRGGKKEEDKGHKTADYLQETEDVWSNGDTVAPSVIGE